MPAGLPITFQWILVHCCSSCLCYVLYAEINVNCDSLIFSWVATRWLTWPPMVEIHRIWQTCVKISVFKIWLWIIVILCILVIWVLYIFLPIIGHLACCYNGVCVTFAASISNSSTSWSDREQKYGKVVVDEEKQIKMILEEQESF